MKQLILFLLLYPVLSVAQNSPRFENDTLYTSCGYKIYKGQSMQFGKATGWKGFMNIIIKNGIPARSLENTSLVVKDLSGFSISPRGNSGIDIKGDVVYKDGSTGGINMSLAFDRAIGNLLPGVVGELIVPEEFRTRAAGAASLYVPAFQDDTLYTSSGYKIYKGLLLQFGKGTGYNHWYRYVNIKNDIRPRLLQYQQVQVRKLDDYGISVLGNAYISITGTLIANNKKLGIIVIHMAFDNAIEDLPGVPSELVVPDEFRNKIKPEPTVEIERLGKLYENGILTKEEFEAQKKKLLAPGLNDNY